MTLQAKLGEIPLHEHISRNKRTGGQGTEYANVTVRHRPAADLSFFLSFFFFRFFFVKFVDVLTIKIQRSLTRELPGLELQRWHVLNSLINKRNSYGEHSNALTNP